MVLPALPEDLVRRFQLGDVLGRGSYGIVLEAALPGVSRPLALKWIPPGLADERCLRELEALSRVRHPHVLAAIEGGSLGGGVYVVMDRAETSLAAWIADPSRRERVWQALRETARGLGALHSAGLVHRDLKPSNILIVGGKAVIADFGLVRAVDARTLTADGTVLGTPGYLSPEQARGDRVGPACDTFALGCMLFQAWTGRLPVAGRDPMEKLLAAAKGELEPVREALGSLPPDAIEAVAACLALDPGDRPRDLEALADRLGVVEAPESPRATVVASRVVPSPRTPRIADRIPEEPAPARRPRPGLVGPAVAAVALAGLGLLFGRGEPPPVGPPPAPLAAAPEPDEDFDRALANALDERPEDLPEAPEEPLDAPEEVVALPLVRRFLGWVGSGGFPETLDAGRREALLDYGSRLRARGFEDPFAPYLVEVPVGPPTPDLATLSRLSGAAPEAIPSPVVPGSWLDRAIELALRLEAAAPGLDAEVERIKAARFPPDFSPELAAKLAMGLGMSLTRADASTRNVVARLFMLGPRSRKACFQWLRPITGIADAFLVAIGRALGEPGGDPGTAVRLALFTFGTHRPSFSCALLRHELPHLLGGTPSTPEAALVLGTLAYEAAVLRSQCTRPTEEARRLAIDFLERASRGPFAGPSGGFLAEVARQALVATLAKYEAPEDAALRLAADLCRGGRLQVPPGRLGPIAETIRDKAETRPATRESMLRALAALPCLPPAESPDARP